MRRMNSEESWQGFSSGSESGSRLGSVNINLKNHVRRPRIDGATVVEATASDRVSTPMNISESESELESLPSLEAIIRPVQDASIDFA